MSDESHKKPSTEEGIDYQERVSVMREHASVVREKSEPESGREPVSLWAFLLASFFLLLGGGYLGANHGGFTMQDYTRSGYEPAPPPPDPYAPAEDVSWIQMWTNAGKNKYSSICAGCHMGKGQGVPGQYPPLAGSAWVTEGNERLAMIIMNGLIGPVEVAGKTFNTAGMQAWKSALTAKELAQVMTYIRLELGNAALLPEGEDGVVTEEMTVAALTKHGNKEGNHVVADLSDFNVNLPGAKVDLETGQPGGAEDAGAAPPEEASEE